VKAPFLMARDDWKHYEDEMEEEEGEKKSPSAEKQCGNCHHWVAREATSCDWCGKPFIDDDGRP
jgi:hypothetical protein